MKRKALLLVCLYALPWVVAVVFAERLHVHTPRMLLFYTLQAVVILLHARYALRRKRAFMRMITEAMVFRMTSALAYVALALVLGVHAPVFFVIQFALLYLLYLVFELLFLFTNFGSYPRTSPRASQYKKD